MQFLFLYSLQNIASYNKNERRKSGEIVFFDIKLSIILLIHVEAGSIDGGIFIFIKDFNR